VTVSFDSKVALGDLRKILGRRLVVDPDVVATYSQDQATFLHPGSAAALAMANCTEDVVAVLRVCHAARIPVVPRGAGTGLSGGANAVDGCVVLSTHLMNRVLEIDSANLLAVVQPGVINADLKNAAAELGLAYPPDPSSYESCSIGGNVATNAGGLCCVRYGVTRDYILGLEVVLADGTVVRTGRRSLKGVAGYDLTSLLVGSEGTLGVITEITAKLRPKLPLPATLVAFFDTMEGAGAAIAAIRQRMIPSMLELMDRRTVVAVESWKHIGLDTSAAAMVVAQSDAGGDAGPDAERMAGLCHQGGATSVVTTADEVESQMLVQARRLAVPAIERNGSWLLDDVAVPCARVPDLIRHVEQIAEQHALDIYNFGHAGDGNMHPTMVFEPGDAAAHERVLRALDDIVVAAIDLGGTSTGEHGVGALKLGHISRELGLENLALQRRIKAAFDPTGILNPGKAI
jgi:glycolate oxidase